MASWTQIVLISSLVAIILPACGVPKTFLIETKDNEANYKVPTTYSISDEEDTGIGNPYGNDYAKKKHSSKKAVDVGNDVLPDGKDGTSPPPPPPDDYVPPPDDILDDPATKPHGAIDVGNDVLPDGKGKDYAGHVPFRSAHFERDSKTGDGDNKTHVVDYWSDNFATPEERAQGRAGLVDQKESSGLDSKGQQEEKEDTTEKQIAYRRRRV